MAGREVDGDGSIADLPWASVFDPAANARALGAIQVRGFRAATEVVDKLVRMADRNGVNGDRTAAPQHNGNGNGHRKPTNTQDVDRMVASWEKVVEQLTRSLRGARPSPTGATTLDLGSTEASSPVYLETAEPGRAVTEVWLHNGSPEDMGRVSLRCSDLLAHHGGLIDSAAVRFDPDVVPMPPRSSRGVLVEVVVAEDVQPGSYRGTLLANEHADIWLPVVLTVRSPAL